MQRSNLTHTAHSRTKGLVEMIKSGFYSIPILTLVLFLSGCSWFYRPHFTPLDAPNIEAWPNTNFTQSKVNINDFSDGGIPRDGIPPIDNPLYIAHHKAIWLTPLEPVIVVDIAGIARAYPLQIMLYHEIVNDSFGGHPVAITFCPMCNTAIAFDRRLGGKVLDFGTTGLLRKSDLVMYDRQTESWWQQFTGEALVGQLAGDVLTRLDTEIVAFGEFQNNYPSGEVLSRETGFDKPYGKNHIIGYDNINSSPYFYLDKTDTRLKSMERVLGVSANGINRIYPFSTLKNTPVINDEINQVPVVVFYHDGMRVIADTRLVEKARLTGAATAFSRDLDDLELSFIQQGGKTIDEQTRSVWNYFGVAISGPLEGKQLHSLSRGVHFSFAWFAFQPSSEIYLRN